LNFKYNIFYVIICFLSISANEITQYLGNSECWVAECEVPGEANSENESESEEEEDFINTYIFSTQSFIWRKESNLLSEYSLEDLHIREIVSPPPDQS